MIVTSFHTKLSELNREFHESNFEHKFLFSIEDLLLEHLKIEPQNTEILLRLVILEFYPPLQDFSNIIYYVRSIFNYDPENIDAALSLAYMYSKLHYFHKIPDHLFNILSRLRPDTPEKAALLEIARAWAYQSRDTASYVKGLEKSIELDPSFAGHYFELGAHYIYREQYKLGRYFLNCGLKNVKTMYSTNYICDTTDIEEFFNENFRETHLCQSTLNYYTDLLGRHSKKTLTFFDALNI